ncbi:MAG: CRISPR-associated helicase Cas3' [Acidobacteria bacterium]|nr:CRISPR-associated helicase Cas3' [Acidobacteriota bacterium]
MGFETLLAKSIDESAGKIPTYARLLPHLRLVQDAGEAIFEMVGEKVLEQIDLNDEVWHSRLKRGLSIACLCHDIGKANDGFQKMVRGEISPKEQPIRHELLSALLLARKGEVRDWALNLLSCEGRFDDADELLEYVIAAVAGHHRKLDEEWKKASIALHDGGCGQNVRMFLTHENLKPLFRGEVSEELEIDLSEDFLKKERKVFHKGSIRFADGLENNSDWWRFAAVLKALTSAADVAGSALPEKDETPRDWIKLNLADKQFLKAEQMREVVNASLKENKLRKFQKAVADSKAKITLVEAGCGTGKTVAAYAWAENYGASKKLFFCYPTTGTATEGFLGYVAKNDVEAELIHSRSSVDIEEMTEVKGDEKDGETEKRLRIESLKMWYPQVIVCTADTVLSLVRNNRRGWYNSPSILSASFVFDELHAYDNRMFAAVIALIKALPNAHFLLMTASLPKERKEFLLKHVEEIEQIQTPKELEELPRYEFHKLSDRSEAFEIAEKARSENLKILWICNTVARTQAVSDELTNRNLPVQTYHSRFKYEDRKCRHRSVIDGFDRQVSKDSLIAVTTQVAEMSLDLDADILISEIAPVPALIQRLGRLNRRINLDDRGMPRMAYFYMPETKSPYGKNDDEAQKIFEQSESWLDELFKLNAARPLSQADLAEHFRKLRSIDENKLDKKALRTGWLDSGWFAMPEEVREPNVSVSVILPEDERVCRENRKEIINKAIPMSYKNRMKDWSELKGNLIAPPNTIEYCKERGARWL